MLSWWKLINTILFRFRDLLLINSLILLLLTVLSLFVYTRIFKNDFPYTWNDFLVQNMTIDDWKNQLKTKKIEYVLAIQTYQNKLSHLKTANLTKDEIEFREKQLKNFYINEKIPKIEKEIDQISLQIEQLEKNFCAAKCV